MEMQTDYLSKDKQLRSQFQIIGKKAAYGTAGFRDLADNMPYIFFRVGVLVTIFNKTQPQKSLGVVVSASHNRREDNGVKITNFKGNMLEKEYEPKVQQFVNEKDLELAVKNLSDYLISKGLTIYETQVTVFIGGDTRPSTEPFLELLILGIQYAGGKALNFHLTTTPQLQFYVFLSNCVLKPQKAIDNPQQIRGQFWQYFSSYFLKAANYLKWSQPIKRIVDCANGVGGKIMPQFLKRIDKYLAVELINHSDDQYLNKQCGADYVKTNKLLPRNFLKSGANSYLSFDGDADRIVFYTETDGKLNLIDGDREGTILTQFFTQISQELKQRTQKINGYDCIAIPYKNPTIGFVQTYYANYSSSDYLKLKFGLDPVYAATGVKNLHEKAQHYDIGIYFEGNGHGTVIFNEDYLGRLQKLLQSFEFIIESVQTHKNEGLQKQIRQYFQFLSFYVSICKLSNPSVGDAICVFLLFQLALKYLKIDYEGVLAIYRDLESLTSKIAVKNKENIKVTEIQDKVVQPVGLQDQIEKILVLHHGKKAFLRASGTQNVLRLHVEAEKRQDVLEITRLVKDLVTANKELN